MPMTPYPSRWRASGFTLIELIITIILISAAAVIITPYLTAITHHPDPVLREQAIALGQAMMDEILAKKWDENSASGGGPICTSESTSSASRASLDPACTYGVSDPQASTPASLGLDAGENATASDRRLWDDVDDYAFLRPAGGNYETDTFWNQEGDAFVMPGFSRWVEVDYLASNELDIHSSTAPSAIATDSKRIVVTVTSPLGETFELVALSCNF